MRALAIALIPLGLFGQSGFRPFFNGKDLSQFIVDTQEAWRVENGVIIGRHDGLKYNDFLRTRESYGNFELQLEFLLKDGAGNSGVQFRSKPVPDSHEVSGYQADIGQQYWGCLYDESRRNKVLAQASPEALATVKKDDWNRYVIRAQGTKIELELNGVKSVSYDEQEPGIEQTGFIALQVHSGPPIEVRFRNLRIKRLP